MTRIHQRCWLQLWQQLSKALGEKITKTFQSVFRRRSQQIQVSHTPSASTKRAMALSQHQDWGERMSPCSTDVLVTLEQWIVQSRCRLVALLGMGGIGKTSLSVKLAEQIQGEFEYLIWRSLLHSLFWQNCSNSCLIRKLTSQKTQDNQISRLIECLRSRCLLVLDNAESILQWWSVLGTTERDMKVMVSYKMRRRSTPSKLSSIDKSGKTQRIGIPRRRNIPVRSLKLIGEESRRTAALSSKGLFSAQKPNGKS